MLPIRPKCIFYVRDNTFKHSAIKISSLEFSGSSKRSEAVLQGYCFITDQIAQNIDSSVVRFPRERYILENLQIGNPLLLAAEE